jgi:murein DD-endopeptidase MepM/ murein hydrolase activator NlpD
MFEKRWVKYTIGIVLMILVAVFGVTSYLFANFPEIYPDETLQIEEEVAHFFEKVTLPIKLARLSSQPADTHIFMPVYGATVSRVANTWHAPRDGDRIHEGQDIFAPKGTPIFSGTDGYVTRITGETIGGISVFITGSGGRHYYYTHLDRYADGLRVGQKVNTDTVIGFVGNTGNAKTTPSHLHLGVFESRQAIDPLPLLTDRPRPQ